MIRTIRWMTCATAVAVLALAGCDHRSATEPEAGVGTVEIHIPPPSHDIVDISRIEIVITGSGISSPIVTDLDGSPASGWSGIISDIPAGLGRTFVGRAYDDVGMLYEGSATPVTIRADETSLVTLFMHELTPPDGFFNSAPRITALVIDAYVVAPGASLTASVTAVDPDDEPLTWAWTSPAGSFDDPASPSIVWTAPGADGSVMLHVGASDPTGATATLDIMVTVGTSSAGGGAYVAADINSGPDVLAMLPDPARVEVGESVYLDLTASDSDGDALAFAWSSSCEGYYDDPTLEDPSFTLDELPDDEGDCLVRVTVSDERGGSNVGELSLASGPGVCGSGPCGPTTLVPGELVWASTQVWDGRQAGSYLAVGPDGTTYVVGSESVDGYSNILVNRFAANGDFLSRSSPVVEGNEWSRGAVVDPLGDFYVAGRTGTGSLLQKWAGGGTPAWTLEIPDADIYDIELSTTNDLVVTGFLHDDIWLATFSRDGGPATWNTTIFDPASTEMGGVAVDLAGNMIVCATRILPSGVWEPFLAKYSPTGERLWMRIHDLGTSRTCMDVEASGSGDLYVMGRVRVAEGTDLWLGRFDSMGNYVGGVDSDLGGYEDIPRSLAVASNGSVYVAVESSNLSGDVVGHWLGAHTPTLATRWAVWPAVYEIGELALHPDGNLMLAGLQDGGATDQDVWLGKFVR